MTRPEGGDANASLPRLSRWLLMLQRALARNTVGSDEIVMNAWGLYEVPTALVDESVCPDDKTG